ncbi:MAG TPA: hypothetical protein VLI91_15610 [Roseiarcus sp.]|nr:hypothetical protein [Roseiarcus sp.]
MNNVIHFRPANRPRRTASGDRGAAQILFFTGVRYQRWSQDPHPPQQRAQGARRKQERAEIGEAGRGRKSQR